jgi:hypothetical protein
MIKPPYKKLFYAALEKIKTHLILDASIEGWTPEEINEINLSVESYFSKLFDGKEVLGTKDLVPGGKK